MTKRILLLGAGGNAGINFIKSLRLSGEQYWVLGADLTPEKILPSPADEKIAIPPISHSERTGIINRICHEYNIDFIHGQPDPEVRYIANNQEKLATNSYKLDINILNKFADKGFCQNIWKNALGIDFSVLSASEISSQSFEKVHARSKKVWVRARTGAGSKAALPVTTLAQAEAWIAYWVEAREMKRDDFILCEYLPGPEYAVQTLWHNGELFQTQARERLEFVFGSIMPSGQSSTPSLARSVNIPAVTETAHAAIRSIDEKPHGIYCVDIRTSHTGQLVPTEVNYGRFFTTSDFFATYGCNGPHSYIQLALSGTTKKFINAIPEGINWSRGLDREPYGYTSDAEQTVRRWS